MGKRNREDDIQNEEGAKRSRPRAYTMTRAEAARIERELEELDLVRQSSTQEDLVSAQLIVTPVRPAQNLMTVLELDQIRENRRQQARTNYFLNAGNREQQPVVQRVLDFAAMVEQEQEQEQEENLQLAPATPRRQIRRSQNDKTPKKKNRNRGPSL